MVGFNSRKLLTCDHCVRCTCKPRGRVCLGLGEQRDHQTCRGKPQGPDYAGARASMTARQAITTSGAIPEAPGTLQTQRDPRRSHLPRLSPSASRTRSFPSEASRTMPSGRSSRSAKIITRRDMEFRQRDRSSANATCLSHDRNGGAARSAFSASLSRSRATGLSLLFAISSATAVATHCQA